MSGRSELDGLDEIEREGLAWVDRLTSDKATVADIEAVREWRARSAAHETAFSAAVRLRRVARGRSTNVVALPKKLHDPSRRVWIAGAVAAGFGGALMVGANRDIFSALDGWKADFRTKTGERRDLDIQKGVSVTLNTETSIVEARASAPMRIIAGEAMVNAIALASPLEVRTRDLSLFAQNARCNVRCDADQTRVTCLEGVLRIVRNAQVLNLQTGQQIISNARGVGAPKPVDVDIVSAWRRGLLIFYDESIDDVLAEVNRYRVGQVVLLNRTLGARRFNGVFHVDRIEEVIAYVQRVAGLRAVSGPGGLLLLS